MEEDIKKIEQIIERCDQCKFHECINCEICWNEVQAIKRLVKGYKELEIIINSLNCTLAQFREYRKESITKSKIREKIEKVRFYIPEYQGEFVNIEDLEDLLGEK